MRRKTGPSGQRVRLPESAEAASLAGAAERSRPGPVPAWTASRAARRRAVLAALEEPRSILDLSMVFGVGHDAMAGLIAKYWKRGHVVRVGRGLYRAVEVAGSAAAPRASTPGRAQPIRDAILAYLSEPRRAMEVAAHIGRGVSNATGHLAAMGRLGLVVRTGYGRYERADLVESGARPVVIVRPFPVRDAVRACLDRPMRVSAVATAVGRPVYPVEKALWQLVALEQAVHLDKGLFGPPVSDASAMDCTRRPVRAARTKAGPPNGEVSRCSP